MTTERQEKASGPLCGVSVVELTAIGPVPFAAMLLADLGASITRVERPPGVRGPAPTRSEHDILGRGRRSIEIDLRAPRGVDVLLRLVARSDVLLEGHRPGVAERMGFGPHVCLTRNPSLVFGRMTGWGQSGPRADQPGHDINYLALSGVLGAMGHADRPPAPPLNLIGDYGGGGMLLAFGVVAALFERARSGLGQVVDAAIVDGVSVMTALFHSLRSAGRWRDEREANLLDGGAHFYGVYETGDGRYLAVGALESQFYARLLERLNLRLEEWPQHDRDRWPEFRERLAATFKARPLAHWSNVFADGDACVTPVNSLEEATRDPHLRARSVYVDDCGLIQPAPAPRFSRTPGRIAYPAQEHHADAEELLKQIYSSDELVRLRADGVLYLCGPRGY